MAGSAHPTLYRFRFSVFGFQFRLINEDLSMSSRLGLLDLKGNMVLPMDLPGMGLETR